MLDELTNFNFFALIGKVNFSLIRRKNIRN